MVPFPGIPSDFVGSLDPTRSDRIRYRIDAPGYLKMGYGWQPWFDCSFHLMRTIEPQLSYSNIYMYLIFREKLQLSNLVFFSS